jgi:hypothetical protein
MTIPIGGIESAPAPAPRGARDETAESDAAAARAALVAELRAEARLRAEEVAAERRRAVARALAKILDWRRLEARQLIMEGLRLVATDERQQFVEATMQELALARESEAVP